MSTWFTSRYTNGSGTCVEVRFDGDTVLVRDTKFRRDPGHDPAAQPTIRATAAQWAALLDAVAGHRADTGAFTVAAAPDGGVALALRGTTLRYTRAEWAAFRAGVADHEFDHPGLVTVPA